MNTKKIIIVVLVIAILAVLGGLIKQALSPVVNDFATCAAAGYPVMESYPARCQMPNGKVFTQDIGNELEKRELIRLDSPRPGAEIASPLEIKGLARGRWFFEASFPARLLDGNGREIAVLPVTALGEWMTEDFVPFSAVMDFAIPDTATGTLILEKDNPSGLPQNADRLIVPVRFSQTAQSTLNLKIYFGRTEAGTDCEQVFPVTRTIKRTVQTGRAALEELLAGPTAEEKTAGYFSSLPMGVKLNSLTIENGVARADFSSGLDRNVGGSCRVSAISAQIRETLKQFPSVKEAVISIDGRTEDILQP